NVVKPDFKIFVGDSLAGNDAVSQAKEFYERTKFDAAILTKSDADARGGAALSIVKITSVPVLYVGVGQEYQDLKAFDKELFLDTVFGKSEQSQITTEEQVEPEPQQVKEEISEQKSKQEAVPEKIEEPEPKKSEEQIPEPEQPRTDDSDPFVGIDSEDINKYADLYDELPPENDKQAKELSSKIKKWISDGRPKPN
ncbi:MAG: signal recognition particle-docking protein FtsY, partial [Thaumarchaeota archaeon]|nr:signal recognition particle-docking protein FtsY [Nitrososphaerota archaeon]